VRLRLIPRCDSLREEAIPLHSLTINDWKPSDLVGELLCHDILSNDHFESLDPHTMLAPNMPRGYYMTAAWWVIRERNEFDLLYDPERTMQEEDEKLQRRCKEAGVYCLSVEASPFFSLSLS
jgi:hypothetical protein